MHRYGVDGHVLKVKHTVSNIVLLSDPYVVTHNYRKFEVV
jgi:hypothetical protein